MHLDIAYEAGAKFKDEMGVLSPVYDSKQKQWWHMNFFEHKTFISAKVPRIKTSQNKVRMIDVPWARKNSGFIPFSKNNNTNLAPVFALSALIKNISRSYGWD